MFFLTERDLAVIGWLYSFKEDFYGVIGSDHLFVKHNLMKKQVNVSKIDFCGYLLRSSSLPKIGLASLAAKKIHLVMKKRSFDQDHKKNITGLSLKGREKDKNVVPTLIDFRQTFLVPTGSSWRSSNKWRPRELRERVLRELALKEDVEILEEIALTRKAKKSRTASSKSSQNLGAEVDESTEGDKEMEPQNSEGARL
ncbi:hypothetical protein Fot_21761 [Forsythia ovata]|uniref:Uncharacterized protein n=1 Tax=Forsythia ovata TaxID=205694 RepID=A0ABD1UXD1_9LAMI